MTTERREVKEEAPTEDVKVSDILKVFKVNKAFLALCLHGVFICFMQYCTETLGIYMYEDVLGNGLLSTMGMAVTGPFMVLIFVFGAKMSKKIGLVKFIRYSLIVGSVLYISLFAYCALTEMNAWVFLIWSGIAMGIASVSIYLQWGLVGEAIDYNKQLTGKRTEGSIYGTFNLSRRVGQTIGTSASLFLLEVFGYNAKLPVQSNLTLLGIKVLCVLLPGIFVLGSWAAFKFVWNINSNTRAKLKEFKEGTSEEETPSVAKDE
jgi:GPH family glycoside/pentoside/hexuronide:cation symporter